MAWFAFVLAMVIMLTVMGGRLAPPTLSGLDELRAWMGQRQPVEAASAALRILALALGWYLLVVIVISVAARLLRLAALVRAVDVVTVPLVRRLANAAAGLSLVATGYPGLAGAGAPPAAETMRRLPDDAGTTGAGAAPAVTTTPPITMRRLPDEPVQPPSSQPVPTPAPASSEANRSTAPTAAPRTTATPTTALPRAAESQAAGPRAGAPKAPAPPEAAAPTSPGPGPGSWTVRPGDHFWSVAERVLADAWGRAATDAEVGPYWRELVDANRSGLPDPANPDLLFPAQSLTVPPPPALPGLKPAAQG
ncbi:MAG: hypothetical protein M3N28_09565 [Actinomycetota bacterium]|nr:hypothetical protein [Actinomycetota bacterium]